MDLAFYLLVNLVVVFVVGNAGIRLDKKGAKTPTYYFMGLAHALFMVISGVVLL